ncbi:zinc ribbon domain-containing protein [Bacillus tianshenii]|uniref:zinc ribbon domain-containing protein n=1 Tax=Sutcliffiella tianshenii TaxID=1463404 RepID=UPI0021E6049E|nr:zinc ribbon domain-containing protein [Bacillus tianshenii]
MANDLQTRLGEGLSKVQGGIEQGKQKLQVAQEISRLKKSMAECSLKKSKILLELGQVTYRKLRSGLIQDEELATHVGSIVGLDKQMYTASKQIIELSKTTQNGIACSCGTVNGATDRFCGGCGSKIEQPNEIDLSTASACGKCEEVVPVGANFCPCCGSKA